MRHSTVSTDVASVRISKVESFDMVRFVPASGCDGYLIGSVVYDHPSRREIALVANSNYRENLLSRIQSDKADVTLRGVYRYPDHRFCRANLLWASK